MDIRRTIETGSQMLGVLKERLGVDPVLVLGYLDDPQKRKLAEAEIFPAAIDFDRASVALATVRGVEKIKELENFLQEFFNVEEHPDFFTKYVRLSFFVHRLSEEEADFVIVFVAKVFGGLMTPDNVGYLDMNEIKRWETAAAAHLRRSTHRVTVLEG